MTSNRQLKFWLIVLAGLGLLLWLLRDALMPFVAGAAIAYVLDPLADRLERLGMPRWAATTLVLLLFLVLTVVVLVVLVPLVASQVIGFLAAVPGYLARLGRVLAPVADRLRERFGIGDDGALAEQLSRVAGGAVSWAGTVLTGVLRGGMALVDLLSLLLITPVVAFYLLRDWDRLLVAIDRFIPRPYLATVRSLAAEVDRTLANFIRGQGLVCLSLGLIYAVALGLVGLNFGLLVGLGAGLISFIPYVGSIAGLLTSVGIALVQFDSWTMWGLVAVIFFAGQILEGYVLTPKLVGESVGLHPVWVIFALLAAGSLFGFTGLLLAVPVAAVIGVVVRFFLLRYRLSSYYLGAEDLPPVSETAADRGGPL